MSKLLEAPHTDLQNQVDEMVMQARQACKVSGDFSQECAAAWDAVEELQAATADRLATAKTDFERYCDTRPDGLECRIYDV